jgi:acyl carrier protein
MTARVKEFIIDRIHVKANSLSVSFIEISDDFSLTGSGLFDSMDFMNLIAEVEAQFGVNVDFVGADPERFTTLEGFIECIK